MTADLINKEGGLELTELRTDSLKNNIIDNEDGAGERDTLLNHTNDL